MKSEILRIDALAYGGDGVGRCSDAAVCFVPGTLPGEVVEAEIIAEKKRFRRGRLLRIISAAPERITPECCHFTADACPGCAYIHCNYDCEIEWKQRQLRDFLVRKALIGEADLLAPFASVRRFGARNKLSMNVRNGVRGYIGRDNETLFAVKSCLLAKPQLNRLLEASAPGADGREVFRFTAENGALKVTGDGAVLTETLEEYGDFFVAQSGFFQTNIPVAAELVRRVVSEVQAGRFQYLMDLYCGVGIFSIASAEAAEDLQVYGVELNRDAVKMAEKNARLHHVEAKCRFAAGDAGKLLDRVPRNENMLVVVDPPRSGLHRQVVDKLLKITPAEIIYISCAADTLVRDLESFRRGGYRVQSAGLLDMFPGTAHFEVMSVLRKE